MAAIDPDNHGLRLVIRYVMLMLTALIFVFPLVFMVVSSFKPDLQLLRGCVEHSGLLSGG
ncbi:hypothetical protein [Primorskyibacter sp. S187A]|uniref:hypothetical protein n=1 Tax=Primorskyibacter sp. S187A TaxID=3415130 RepID=UPI003C7D87FC